MSIRYDDKRVKRPNIELEYTNEDILELEKCSNDINQFLKYVKIINPDRGEEYFQPYNYQKKLLKALSEERFVISLQSRQSGKCVSSETITNIRNKRTGQIEEISIENFFNKMKK